MGENKDTVKVLDRYLSPFDVMAMAVGVIVGWGAFVMPGTTFLPVGGTAGTFIAMLVSTVIILIIGSNFAFLMKRNPVTGGVYSYTKEAFGRDHAFISSWFLCLSYLTIVFLNGTALFVVVRTVMDDTIAGGAYYTVAGNNIYIIEVLISAAAFAAVGLLFVSAKPFLQKLFVALSVIMIAGVIVMAAFCIPHLAGSDSAFTFGTQGYSKGFSVFTLVILAPWAFVGFDTASFDTAHFDFSTAKIKKIIFAAIIIAGLMYIALVFTAASFVPAGYSDGKAYLASLDEIGGMNSVPVFGAASAYMGTAGTVIAVITALAAIFTGIIGAYRAALRILSTMAEDHILSAVFRETKASILFIMLISVLLSLLGRNTLEWFVDITSFGAIVGFGYTSAAAWRLGRAEGKRSVVRTGLAGTVLSALFVIVQLIPHLAALEPMGSEAFFLLALWCLLGFIFYLKTVNETDIAEFTGISTAGVILFALLLYSSLMWAAKRIASAESSDAHRTLMQSGVVVIILVFTGLAAMMHVQNLIRQKHEAVEREKIRAVESSLAKSQFLFNMSHDIRTPLNAIIGYTHLAGDESDTGLLHEYLSKIEASSQHLLDLINDVLEMSRIESGNTELEYVPADLCLLFEDIRDLFDNQMKDKGIDFSVQTSQVRDRYVWFDKKSLTRVLMNVISNAYKFTPEGGSVSVVVWQDGKGDDGYTSYEMRVHDSGIGMSKDFVERMFTAFERERSSTTSGIEGTGLGLAITKKIVDLMGGTIEVITSPGSGTEMIIRLRFRQADESEVKALEIPHAAEESKTVDFSTKRLLLAEDNTVNMEIACMILRQMGFEVETAVNGQIAVDMVKGSEPGYYDLVLMDIQMPVMDGYEATRSIRSLKNEKLAAIPVIAMTANAFAEDVQAAQDAGMQAHIAKPIDISVMTRTLNEVLSAAEYNNK